jgi:16S rRNA (adenine1518-N6/adenine1519-N6)-dimethyltransferase
MPLSRRELKALLSARGLHLSKQRGQNYLVDAGTIAALLDRLPLDPQARVLEIGAGLGALTEGLARRVAQVTAVEIDRGIFPLLQQQMQAFDNVELIHGDILDYLVHLTGHWTVVGAIPYGLTTPILEALTVKHGQVDAAGLVVQQELARRLVAQPRSPDYSRLSVYVQFYWQVRWVMDVPRTVFFPQPAVDSCLLRLVPQAKLPAVDSARFFRLVKAAFAHRRKKLAYGLSAAGLGIADRQQANALVAAACGSADVRAEELSLSDYLKLYHAIHNSVLSR